jgi:hypothetical protein
MTQTAACSLLSTYPGATAPLPSLFPPAHHALAVLVGARPAVGHEAELARLDLVAGQGDKGGGGWSAPRQTVEGRRALGQCWSSPPHGHVTGFLMAASWGVRGCLGVRSGCLPGVLGPSVGPLCPLPTHLEPLGLRLLLCQAHTRHLHTGCVTGIADGRGRRQGKHGAAPRGHRAHRISRGCLVPPRSQSSRPPVAPPHAGRGAQTPHTTARTHSARARAASTNVLTFASVVRPCAPRGPYLWVCVDDGGHRVVVDVAGLAADDLNGRHPVLLGLVGQHGTWGPRWHTG